MAVQDNKENGNSGSFFQIFSGTDTEIFNKLPNQDRRPYRLIGFINLCSITLTCILLYIVLRSNTNSFGGKILLSGLFFILIHSFHKRIVSKLIHHFIFSRMFSFICYAIFISSLFYILLSFDFINHLPTAEEKAAAEKTIQDSITASDEEIRRMDEQAALRFTVDSLNRIKANVDSTQNTRKGYSKNDSDLKSKFIPRRSNYNKIEKKK